MIWQPCPSITEARFVPWSLIRRFLRPFLVCSRSSKMFSKCIIALRHFLHISNMYIYTHLNWDSAIIWPEYLRGKNLHILAILYGDVMTIWQKEMKTSLWISKWNSLYRNLWLLLQRPEVVKKALLKRISTDLAPFWRLVLETTVLYMLVARGHLIYVFTLWAPVKDCPIDAKNIQKT